MGTMLQSAGLPVDIPPELWNVENPDVIERIHREYIQAGAQIITTNTFGASGLKLSAYELQTRQSELITAGVRIARKCANDFDTAVAGSIGPLGLFLQPFGELTFDDAYNQFFQYAKILADAGVDLIIIETMTDLVELKSAVLATMDATDIPIVANFAFDEGDSSVTGTPPEVFAAVMDALDIQAMGTNCGKGLEPVENAIAKMRKYTPLPLVAQPNAGLPKNENGRTIFPASPQKMADSAVKLWESGANIIGACCGSTPEHIARIADAVRGKPVHRHNTKSAFFCASRVKLVEIDETTPVRLIGERINPSGRKKFKERLKFGDIGIVKQEAVRQRDADILDICVAAPQVDEVEILPRAVSAVANLVVQPIFIDTTDINALEKSLKLYPGLPVINSISAKSDQMTEMLSLAKRWGASFVALAMNDDGIPISAQGRMEIIEQIISSAEDIGISANRILADPIMLPVSADIGNANITLGAIRLISERLNIPTVIGLSNVSYGLPSRSILNSAMLVLAVNSGLCAVISDPTDENILQLLSGAEVLAGKDTGAKRFIEKFSTSQETQSYEEITGSLYDDIIYGNTEWVSHHLEKELESGNDPLDILNEIVIPAIRRVGDKYDKREIYLPQVISSAEATMSAIKILRSKFPSEQKGKGKIVLATVFGDVHDIGKNLVKALLESYGFDVVDLGKNVPSQKILDELHTDDFIAVGLSALMTTTLESMKETVSVIREKFPDLPIIVGGAAVSSEFANQISAIYADNAVEAAKIVDKISG